MSMSQLDGNRTSMAIQSVTLTHRSNRTTKSARAGNGIVVGRSVTLAKKPVLNSACYQVRCTVLNRMEDMRNQYGIA